MKNYLLRGLSLSALVLSTGLGACSPRSTPTIEQEITIEATEKLGDKVSPTATLEPSISATPTPIKTDFTGPLQLDSDIAFAVEDENYLVDIYVLSGSVLERITFDNRRESNLTWSPDGQQLAYTSYDTSTREKDLRLINRSAVVDDLPVILASDVNIHYVEWSPNSDLIAFITSGQTRTDMLPVGYKLNLIDTNTKEITSLAEAQWWIGDPNWSPDGKSIIFDGQDDDNKNRIYKVDIETEEILSLTPNIDWVRYADWSPDGQYIIYDSGYNDKQSIFRMNKDGSNKEVLIHMEDKSLFNPIYSPDGNTIIFQTRGLDDVQSEIFLMDSDGSNVRQVLNNLPEEINYLNLGDWSPDGTNLAFSAQTYEGDYFYVANPENGVVRKLSFFDLNYPAFHTYGNWVHSDLAWSPVIDPWVLSEELSAVINIHMEEPSIPNNIEDRVAVALADRHYRKDIWIISNEEGFLRLTNDRSSEGNLTWSPDGVYLAYQSSNWWKGDHSFNVINTTNLEKRQLFDDLSNIIFAQWSPVGDNIAVLTGKPDSSKTDLYLVNAETSEKRLIHANVEQVPISWSPDGQRILYLNWDGINLMDVETGESKLLKYNISPSNLEYSPDGENILFTASDGVSNRLYIMNNDRSIIELDDLFAGGSASWSPDSKKIVYQGLTEENSIMSKIYIIDTQTGQRRRLTNTSDRVFSSELFPEWSPSGNEILFNLDGGGVNSVYVINTDGTNQRQIPFTGMPDFLFDFGGYIPENIEYAPLPQP